MNRTPNNDELKTKITDEIKPKNREQIKKNRTKTEQNRTPPRQKQWLI
jgi:hypothetical protein